MTNFSVVSVCGKASSLSRGMSLVSHEIDQRLHATLCPIVSETIRWKAQKRVNPHFGCLPKRLLRNEVCPKPRNGYAQRFRLPLMNSKLSESQFYDCWLSTERKRKHFQIKSPNGCEKRRSVGRGEENDLSIFKRKGTKTPSEIIMLLLDNSSPTRKWTLKRDG